MNWIQCIVYAFTIGFAEFVPISTSAHEQLLQTLFGASQSDYVRDLIIHIFSLAAFMTAWRGSLEIFSHNIRISRHRRGNYGRINREIADSKFVRAAAIPMLLMMILIFYFSGNSNTTSTVLLLLVSGIIMYLPDRMLQGNKTARGMSSLDAWIIGAAAAFSVIPGFSRIGMSMSVAQMRGADRRHALNWAYMLSIPALLLLICADLVRIIFSAQLIMLSSGFWGYLLFAAAAFAGTYTSVSFSRNIIVNHGMNGFAYYSWGAALFGFILYLL